MGHRGHDLIVVGLTTTSGELYLIQHYVIKFVSDLRQVSGFVHVLRFPPPIKLTAMQNWNIVENDIKHHDLNTGCVGSNRILYF